MAEKKRESLYFDVSSGLKRVIGRDLITNDEVAVFELVKNSFDASAKHVQLYISGEEMIVADDGNGMDYNDLTQKWLFVAYSSKGGADLSGQYREQIGTRKNFAGSKGIGRFSSDRLGSKLILQTCPKGGDPNVVHELVVDWELFEKDTSTQFESVPVEYRVVPSFDLPANMRVPLSGTVIKIDRSRFPWDRERILSLKSALAKLINPFGADADGFRISIVAPDQESEDETIRQAAGVTGEGVAEAKVANGDVGNFIFSTLKEKTTFTEVSISSDGGYIESLLVDRGELIYKIREPNPYSYLIGSGFSCQLYYLNQSAKVTFTRRMGMPSVQFGSVFLFRNGFRVYPVGEEGDDSFGIDRRKQQGFARFLGTRDIIGRLDVNGSEENFKEASSRNQGLIDSPAVRQLHECFWEFCLKRLERYIVPVTWSDSADKTSDNLSRLLTDSGRARVTSALAKLVDNPRVEVIEYSKRLTSILSERSSQFEDSINNLRSIAEKTQDSDLMKSLERAEVRFSELKAAEVEAVRIAAQERAAKEAAQQSAIEARAEVARLSEDLSEEKKRASFLVSINSLEVGTMLNMHHQITIYAADLKQQVENCISASRARGLTLAEVIERLESVAFLNQKILSISRLAVKANFRLESDTIECDLAEYIESYIDLGAKPFLGAGINVRTESYGATLLKRFGPMEVSVVVDNLISNAKKAGATEVVFSLKNIDKKTLLINVFDNGPGFSRLNDQVERVFELGFSRSSGSGLGLYHVRQALGEIGGSIAVDSEYVDGAKFDIKVSA
ncbi:sensor histidine kinase [Pseudomonas sp. LF19]|uniref:sensor histidine kinase n=1 Tax=Pseudomonas sp. LF19 TaxID=2899115 RepID=UPI001F34629F|nr:ATP-binding protein [Pseudomonas sp. LF19]MCE5981763.1 ATP-binding protein [Pseudomonas sp. LF19]